MTGSNAKVALITDVNYCYNNNGTNNNTHHNVYGAVTVIARAHRMLHELSQNPQSK